MARGRVEILFPLAEVSDTAAQAVYVDGLANTAYGPGPPLGATAPGARPHQIATDTVFAAGGGGGGSMVFDRMIGEAGNAIDTTSAFTNLIYFEFTIDMLSGSFASAPGEIQFGFASAAYPVDDPGYILTDGDIGLPVGFDGNSVGVFDAATSGYAAFGTVTHGGTGITYQETHCYGVSLDLAAKTFMYRDNTALLAGPPSAYATAPYGFTSTVYPLAGFGSTPFHIAFSLAYKGGMNKLSLNPGSVGFRIVPPPGSTPWDTSGNTHLATVGSGLTLSGRFISAESAADNGIIYGAFTNTAYTLL